MQVTADEPQIKSKVYGRSLEKDLNRMSYDLDLQRAFSVFSKYNEIRSISHLAEVLKISHASAADRLECLQNLNLVVYKDGSYRDVTNGCYLSGPIGQKKERKQIHAYKLIQLAGLLKEADNFSDLNITACSNDKNIHELHNDILLALEKFRAANSNLQEEDKTQLLSLSLGYIFDDITERSGEQNV